MRAYLAYIQSTLRLTSRDRLVLFFNYLFPMLIFAGLGEGTGAKVSTGAATQLFSMVIILGVLGNGFFGGGMRAVMEREQNILRRFKVAPITPGPVIVASLFVGWLIFMPSVFLFWVLSHWRYQLAGPQAPISFLIFVSIGVVAFRSMGMIVASVVNSMQESQILVQLLYLPMLMLSGATVPLEIMPDWLQSVSQFIPATHMYLGLQGILVRGENLVANWQSAAALLLTTLVCSFLCFKLFRWEKEEKVKGSAKLWVAVALLPFLLIGGWQAWSKTNLTRTRILAREKARSVSWLIQDARLFVGDGTVVDHGSLLIRDGIIVRIYNGSTPDPDSLRAEAVEATGKTVLPGFIDGYTFLGFENGPGQPAGALAVERALRSYLYCGVIGVRDQTARMPVVAAQAQRERTSEIDGAEIFPATSTNPVTPPLLAFREIMMELGEGKPDFLGRSLYQQVLPPGRLEQLRAKAVRLQASPGSAPPNPTSESSRVLPGSGGGLSQFAVHGPLLHRELQLWVMSGTSPMDALLAATARAASAAGAATRLGQIKPGFEASLLIVEGDPLRQIEATERIWRVMHKGAMVNRASLFEKDRQKK